VSERKTLAALLLSLALVAALLTWAVIGKSHRNCVVVRLGTSEAPRRELKQRFPECDSFTYAPDPSN
jgi:hypothetical protein